MREWAWVKRLEAGFRRMAAAGESVGNWFEPHRRAAFVALIKAGLLLGALAELGWLLHKHYFSHFFPQFPLSIAWSMLTVIFFITWAQVSWSIALKLRSERGRRLSAAATMRLTALLAAHISGANLNDEIKHAATDSPADFESCVVAALLGLRGAAFNRLCELPEVIGLRARWIAKARTGDDQQRRHAIEHMALLRDPAAIGVLEKALEDPVAGVVASAVRGLVQMPAYEKRDELIASLVTRPFLVRVLAARESANEAPAASPEIPAAVDDQGAYESAEAARERCSDLVASGASGRDLLRLMAALGVAGDAPAEALGRSLAAAARGGIT